MLGTVLSLVGILAAYMAVQWSRLLDDDMVTAAIGAGELSRARDVLAGTAVSIDRYNVAFSIVIHAIDHAGHKPSCCSFHKYSNDLGRFLLDTKME